jgi:hypothetical protein
VAGKCDRTTTSPLQIRGTLPAPRETCYRPNVLYLKAEEGKDLVERIVQVRVPKHCSRRFLDGDLKVTGCQGVDFRLIEESPSADYREFVIRIAVPASRLGTAAGKVNLDTGCGLVEVNLHTD